MVKSKKMSKSTVAIVLLSLLLVLSLILTATGAWFTDTKSADKDITFGTLKLDAITMDGVAVENTIETANVHLMPGSTVSGQVAVKNSGNSAAWLRYKITVTVEGAGDISFENSGDYQYVEAALAGGATANIDISTTVATTVGNTAQGKEVKVQIVVEALQQANTADTNTEAIWKGVQVVEVGA